MHAHSSFDIKLTVAKKEIRKVAKLVAKAATDEYEFEDFFDFEDIKDFLFLEDHKTHYWMSICENYVIVCYEDIVELAKQIAGAVPTASFQITGTFDASESAGEYMDFQMTYQDKKLIVASSCWYLWEEEGLQGNTFVLDSGSGKEVSQVPLDNVKEYALPCAGLTFVITGKLTLLESREELAQIIKAKAGKVSGTVNKNTSFLINNDTDSTSSKNQKAMELSVPIISEDDFLKRFAPDWNMEK